MVWAASSSNANSLNGDFACHDGAGGDPTLSGIAPPPTVLDPDRDSDGDGYTDRVEIEAGSDPNDASSVPTTPVGDGAAGTSLTMQGGGGCGCTTHGRAADDLLLLFLPLLLVLGARARSRGSAHR